MQNTQIYNLIAEIGCNHQGDMDKAKELILNAKNCGCNFVKFQKREPRLQFSPEKYNAPHPNPENAFGNTYGEHREKLEFTKDEHKILMDFANSIDVEYSCSVFDIVSAQNIIAINPNHIKIPSPINTNLEVVEYIAKNFNKTIHVSLGMTTREEEFNVLNTLNKFGKLQNTIIYHCVSSYPTLDADISLLEIDRYKKEYGGKVKAIGLSAHHLDYLPDCIALSMGAEYLERHFTFDKKAKGSDHKISLDYAEMKELNDNLKRTTAFLHYKEKEILDCELKTYNFHKYKNEVVK